MSNTLYAVLMLVVASTLARAGELAINDLASPGILSFRLLCCKGKSTCRLAG